MDFVILFQFVLLDLDFLQVSFLAISPVFLTPSTCGDTKSKISNLVKTGII